MNAVPRFGELAAVLSRRTPLTVLAILVGLAPLLATGAYSGRDWAALFRSVMERPGPVGGSGRGAPADELRLIDPASIFPQERVGYLLFSTFNSDQCRRALFDNRTGTIAESGQVFCGQPPDPNEQIGQERARALLRVFRK